MNQEKNTKCILNIGIAKKLVNMGAKVVDLKPLRENRDKTVVVFACDEVFNKAFTQINEEIKMKKQEEDVAL